jgi:ABC-type multidrug transport system ATPase subunit
MISLRTSTSDYDNCLQVINLQKSYNRPLFPNNFSFSVKKGELAVIIGPSGTGKSTLMKCLLGLQKFEQGSVLLGGSYSFLMSENHLNEDQTIEENFINYYNTFNIQYDWSKIQQYLRLNEQVKLNQKISSCSFGTQRRLALYRVLFEQGNPLVFLDEPTTGLDPENVQKVAKLIAEFQKSSNRTFLIITHEQQLAMHADKIILLSKRSHTITKSDIAGFFKMKKKDLKKVIKIFKDLKIRLIYEYPTLESLIFRVLTKQSFQVIGDKLDSLNIRYHKYWKSELNDLKSFIRFYYKDVPI